jgi:hypothetical protein
MSVLSKPRTSHSFRVSYRISHPQENSLISKMEEEVEEEREEKEEDSLGYYETERRGHLQMSRFESFDREGTHLQSLPRSRKLTQSAEYNLPISIFAQSGEDDIETKGGHLESH